MRRARHRPQSRTNPQTKALLSLKHWRQLVRPAEAAQVWQAEVQMTHEVRVDCSVLVVASLGVSVASQNLEQWRVQRPVEKRVRLCRTVASVGVQRWQ